MIKEKRKRNFIVRFFVLLLKIAVIAAIFIMGINIFVIKDTEDSIVAELDSENDQITEEEAARLGSVNADCIMVLGASVKNDGTPSLILRDRLDLAIELYKKGVAPKLLFSGDNGQVVYNEVSAMKNYAVSAGIPEEDIFLDHAGFSTYESVYRAEYIFKVESVIVVTQKYHLYRAVYACHSMGIDVLGAASDQRSYKGQEKREIREVLARDKDFVKWIIKPQPTFLGEEIPVSGNGQVTH